MNFETPYEMALGVTERFRYIRKLKRITIKELSQKSGVPYSTIRRFESKGEISFLAFVKITSTIGENHEITNLFEEYTPESIADVIRANRRR